MGTYTTNKNLFMPTIGEQGWGELVNGNFETIDNFLKPITVSGSTYTFTGNHVGNQSGGTITATKITNSGTLTQTGTSTFTGKITANGGIGTKALTTTSISNSGNMTNTGTLTSTGKIYANGGLEIVGDVIGNVVGKISISSLGDEPNNLKVCEIGVAPKSVSYISEKGYSGTISISSADFILTKYNTSIINFVQGDNGMLSSFGTNTCTITLKNLGSMTSSIVVKCDGTTLVSKTLGNNGTTTFPIEYGKSYTIACTHNSNMGNSSGQNTVTTSVPNVIKYVP